MQIRFAWIPTIEFEKVFSLIGKLTDKNQSVSISFDFSRIDYINGLVRLTLFSISISLIAFILGNVARFLVLTLRLDIIFPDLLKFKNEWFYILSGRDLLFSPDKSDRALYRSKLFIIRLNFLCEIGDAVVLYHGTIYDYKLKNDSLEYISIYNIQREIVSFQPKEIPQIVTQEDRTSKPINSSNINTTEGNAALDSDKSQFENSKQEIAPSHCMVFKFQDIKNLNVSYI